MLRIQNGIRLLLVAGLLTGIGCKKYRADPLVPEEILANVEQVRAYPDVPVAGTKTETDTTKPALTFTRAVSWLKHHGPEVRKTIAAYHTALATAKVKTPFPNPALEVGPQFGFGPDMGSSYRTAPFGSIGFTIPLGGRLKKQDALNKAHAEVAQVEALCRFRELYLDLRGNYSSLLIAHRRKSAQQAVEKSAELSVAAVRKLVEAGQAAALDVALFEMEYSQSRLAAIDADKHSQERQSELARLLGVSMAAVGVSREKELPVLPPAVPEWNQLKTDFVHNNTTLARLRARYEAAERSLRLEISKQYPDFQIGPSFDKETGEKKGVLGLTLGIELPLFNRNQQGIARAEKAREEVRVEYENAMNIGLTELEKTFRQWKLEQKRFALVKENVMPQAEAAYELAKKTIEAGAGNVLQLLEAERTRRRLQMNELEAEESVRNAFIALERAVGRPLSSFPGETGTAFPEPPANLPHAAIIPAPKKTSDEKEEAKQ